MDIKMETSSRRNSSVIQIPSMLHKSEEAVIAHKMNIRMILNPSDIEVKTEHHADKDSVDSEMGGHVQREHPQYMQQPRPISNEHPLIHFQPRLEALENQNHTLLTAARAERTQLPMAPIHQRPCTFNPINAHHRYANQCSLPPIHRLHDERYCSPSPTHHHHHEPHHQLHNCRNAQSLPTTKKRSPKIKSPKKKSNSSDKYTVEEVDFIRYYREDLKKGWDEVLSCFRLCFVGHQRGTKDSLNSRYYRDNCWNMYDSCGRPILNKKGKMRTISAKVRSRVTPAGRKDSLPYTLVEKNPERCLRYSWVLEQHKVVARRLAAEMSDQEREIMISQRVQKLRNEISGGMADDREESIDQLMDESSVSEGSSRTLSPRIYTPSSPGATF